MENVTVKDLRGVRSQPRHACRGFLCNKGILQRSTGRSYLRRNVNVNASNDDENTKHQEAGVEGGQREQPGAVTVSEEPPEPKLQLPKDVVQRLKDTVFGFDSFFVTSSGWLVQVDYSSSRTLSRELGVITEGDAIQAACFVAVP